MPEMIEKKSLKVAHGVNVLSAVSVPISFFASNTMDDLPTRPGHPAPVPLLVSHCATAPPGKSMF